MCTNRNLSLITGFGYIRLLFIVENREENRCTAATAVIEGAHGLLTYALLSTIHHKTKCQSLCQRVCSDSKGSEVTRKLRSNQAVISLDKHINGPNIYIYIDVNML